MQRAELDADTYPLVFGHTHEDYLRIAFLKDDGTMSREDMIKKGREILKKKGIPLNKNRPSTLKMEGNL